MRFRSIWSEALRNIATGTTHAGLLALTCGLVALALAGVDLAAVTALQRQADVFHASGRPCRSCSPRARSSRARANA